MAPLSSHSINGSDISVFICAQRRDFSNTHQGKSSIFTRNSTKSLTFQSCKFSQQNSLTLTSVQNSASSLLKQTDKEHIIYSRIHPMSEFNNLLMDFVDTNKPENALKLFGDISAYGLSPNCQTFSIMIRCHCKTNNLDGAKRVLDDMLENGIIPNVATFTVIIDSYCKKGRMKRAMEVFKLMEKFGCRPTVITYNCLMKGLCYVGRVDEACDVLMNMKKNTLFQPNVYSYTCVMDGLCKAGRSDEARELLDEAIEMGLMPCVVTYNTLLDGYCREGRLPEGFGLLKLMKERGCAPSHVNYCTLLNGLLHWGDFRPALRIYKEMQVEGFSVDVKMTRSLLRGLCSVSYGSVDLGDEILQVFEQLCRVHVLDSGTLKMVLGALCTRKKFDKALVVLRYMMNLGYYPKMFRIDNVIKGLCEDGMVEDAVSILVLMHGKNGSPSRNSYKHLTDALNQQGKLSSACSVFVAALKRGIISY